MALFFEKVGVIGKSEEMKEIWSFFIDEQNIGMNMALSGWFPLSFQRVIMELRRQRSIGKQHVQYMIKFVHTTFAGFLDPLYVAFELCGEP